MEVHITTDKYPTNEGSHQRENWESPLLDKFNDAFDYLIKIESEGDFHCHFNSSSQIFTPNYERCSKLSKTEIDTLIKTINSL